MQTLQVLCAKSRRKTIDCGGGAERQLIQD